MPPPITSFDSVVLAAVASDVEVFVGGRIVRVIQPAPDELAFDIRQAHHAATLLASIHPRWARVHLSAPVAAGPLSNFGQLLRARLEGAQLVEVRQPAFDRTLTLTWAAMQGSLALVIEIMGRHSNIILVQADLVAGCLKLVPRTKSFVREVLPGRPYTSPPRDRPTPDELTPESLTTILANSTEPLVKRLSTAVLGLSPVLATELAILSRLDPQGPAQTQSAVAPRLWKHLEALRTRLATRTFEPVIYYQDKTPVGYAPFPFVHLAHLRAVRVAGMSEAVDAVVSQGSVQARLEEDRTRLVHTIDRALARVQKTAHEIRDAVTEADQAQMLRQQGEILLAYASQVPPGTSEVTLPGHDGTLTTIPLDPTVSAIANAQRLFKRASKLRAARATLIQRLQQADAEQGYLDAVRVHILQATTSDDLFDLRRELIAQGYLRAARAASPRPSAAARPRTFRLPSGETILVGRSNLENDYLTFKVAAPEDLWFHARGVPGAHVILRLNGKPGGERAIRQAAAIAAYFSQARGAGSVAVDCTQRRNVRKPRGARPGMVVYERERTIHTPPALPQDPDVE